MDRRQQKTRNAIFDAFILLLAQKEFSRITVSDIIESANIGRATFYAHFETKDFLLKELCKELFDHVFESAVGSRETHAHIFNCTGAENIGMHIAQRNVPDTVFLHLLQHLQNNDNNILLLLSCPNNDLFLRYFKENLCELVKKQMNTFRIEKPRMLPADFWINHISATFVETVRWWIGNKMLQSPEVIAEYFLQSIQPV